MAKIEAYECDLCGAIRGVDFGLYQHKREDATKPDQWFWTKRDRSQCDYHVCNECHRKLGLAFGDALLEGEDLKL